jgi:integrase
MATVNLIHHVRENDKKDYPVVFVIRNEGTHSHLSTEIKLPKKFFDDKKWIKKGAPKIIDNTFTNARLRSKLNDIQSFITKLAMQGTLEGMSASTIKRLYLAEQNKEKYNFNTYFNYCNGTKQAEKTKQVYEYTLQLIEKYSPGELRFSDITVKFLRDLELWMIDKGMKINTISIHMRNIRAVFNMAIDDDVIDLSLYPFRKFKIKSEKTVKRNLTIDEFRRLLDVNLPGVPGLARDVFMLSFCLIGINLKDLTYLTKKNIVNGRLEYKRMKTGKDYSIKLEPEAKQLIKKLSGTKYLVNLAERYQNYDAVKKEINKKLKVAAAKAKIDKPISTYYARHSWATIASGLKIEKETISAALGHEIGSETTAIYIEYDMNLVDKANKKVIASISSR